MAHEIRIPRLGWSMEEGTFVAWLKKDGDMVCVGDPLFELESAKGIQEVESIDSGILRIPSDGPSPDSTMTVGVLLGYLVEIGEPTPWESVGSQIVAEQVSDLAEAGSVVHQENLDLPDPSTNFPSAGSNKLKNRPRSTPRARRIAKELGVDWSKATGTGVRGRVRETDIRRESSAVFAASANGGAQPSDLKRVRIVPHTPRRRTIAQRMLASTAQTAPVTLTTRVDVTNLVSLRKQFKTTDRPVPTYTDIAVKLAALALQVHPEFAARWNDDHLELPAEDVFDIGIAVDVEGGLVVPVLRDAARRPLMEIIEDSIRLVAQARNGRLTSADLEGGVFTVTNLGAFGIDAFTPIINFPQTAILGLGTIRREPVVKTGDEIKICDLQTLSLTFDHRAVDGAPAARFLQTISSAFTNPWSWLIGLRVP